MYTREVLGVNICQDSSSDLGFDRSGVFSFSIFFSRLLYYVHQDVL
ncbi:hypothetical protein RchiOBHm_Chr3g0474971 [Rosa chinensis]|uniref:Uncharacterized protein n=1 Tax=Rosa chinensis TaxID=74649 RepID=A0A2P6RCB1_ROSCH|nr:hypothetical protein RchiOBHm_Chr3g0474971 [Rosa chinensis]